MSILRSIIIDDEQHARSVLTWELEQVCPEVEIVEICKSGEEGLIAIAKHKPDLIFLDAKMPHLDGFAMLKRIPQPFFFETIFTTAYRECAWEAFKVNAIDFLLKPIDPVELVNAIQKVIVKKKSIFNESRIAALLEMMQHDTSHIPKIALPTLKGLEFVLPDQITYCKADSNYTHIFLAGKAKILVSRPLKFVEKLLEGRNFFRVHKGALVNLAYLKTYLKGDGGQVILQDGATLNVSRHRKEAFLKLFFRKGD